MSSTEQSEALSLSYVARQLEAAVRLFRVDPAAVEAFDTTVDGFFRSFLALFIAAPFATYQIAISYPFQLAVAQAEGVTPLPTMPQLALGLVLIHATRFVLTWIAFPIVLGLSARTLGLMNRYVPFVVAYNWAALINTLIMMLPLLLFGLGVANVALAGVLLLAAMGVTLYYGWSVAVSTLQVPPLIGVGIVAFDTVLSVFINVLFESLNHQLLSP